MKKIYRQMFIASMVFFALSMTAIVCFSQNKSIEISNIAQDEVYEQDLDNDIPLADSTKKIKEDTSLDNLSLKFEESAVDTDYLCIPLPAKTAAKDIVVENHYMDHKMYVILSGIDAEFYKDNAISGYRDAVLDGSLEATADGVKLCFMLDGLYEYKSVLESDSLYISFYSPREMFDKIVVIDPACGGADDGDTVDEYKEKDIVLLIAQKLKLLLDETDVKVYYTRMEDVNPTKESRVALVNDTKADAYIRIETDLKEDGSIYGVTSYYNEDYFIPGFGNVELADVMEQQVVTAIKGKALGLSEATRDDYTLIHSTVPSTIVKVGCLSNRQEAGLLVREDYIEKIAKGIFDGIMEVYE